MRDDDRPATAPGEPRRNWLRRILQEGPEAQRRLARAVAALLGTALVALGAIGVLLIWHLVRRGRLIQQRLNPPRNIRMPTWLDDKVDAHDQDHGEAPTA
ncbi:MAG: hypothetical protein ACLQGP_06625 [Isosphaeraceae bacterium]